MDNISGSSLISVANGPTTTTSSSLLTIPLTEPVDVPNFDVSVVPSGSRTNTEMDNYQSLPVTKLLTTLPLTAHWSRLIARH